MFWNNQMRKGIFGCTWNKCLCCGKIIKHCCLTVVVAVSFITFNWKTIRKCVHVCAAEQWHIAKYKYWFQRWQFVFAQSQSILRTIITRAFLLHAVVFYCQIKPKPTNKQYNFLSFQKKGKRCQYLTNVLIYYAIPKGTKSVRRTHPHAHVRTQEESPWKLAKLFALTLIYCVWAYFEHAIKGNSTPEIVHLTLTWYEYRILIDVAPKKVFNLVLIIKTKLMALQKRKIFTRIA